jgi:hypothetical protein
VLEAVKRVGMECKGGEEDLQVVEMPNKLYGSFHTLMGGGEGAQRPERGGGTATLVMILAPPKRLKNPVTLATVGYVLRDHLDATEGR